MAISISKVSIGDFCWFKRPKEPKVHTGEIKSIHENENAITIMAHPPYGGFYVIACSDCWFEDPKNARKKQKRTQKKKLAKK